MGGVVDEFVEQQVLEELMNQRYLLKPDGLEFYPQLSARATTTKT